MSAVPKFSHPNGGSICGRRGMAREHVDRMYADYLRLRSLALTAELHGRTRQSLYDTFKRRGLRLYPRNFKSQIQYGGRTFTPGKNGYLRDTIFRKREAGEETLLHRRVWVEHHGPIPAGHTICFKDGDRRNCAIGNLEMLTHDEQQQRRGTGANQFTTTAKSRLALLMRTFEHGEGALSAQLKGRNCES